MNSNNNNNKLYYSNLKKTLQLGEFFYTLLVNFNSEIYISINFRVEIQG